MVYLLLSITCVNAQESEPQKTKFGLKFGRSMHYAKGDQEINRINYFGGVFVERKLDNKFDIQVELLYEIVYQLELPISVKYNFNEKFGVYLGGELNYLLKERGIARIEESFGSGINIGVQYNIGKNLFLDLKYTYGLNDQFRFSSTSISSKQTFRIGVGYKF